MRHCVRVLGAGKRLRSGGLSAPVEGVLVLAALLSTSVRCMSSHSGVCQTTQGSEGTCASPTVDPSNGTALRYHDATKHHFDRYARSLGYMDWATQPNPFRRFVGAPLEPLPHAPLVGDVAYDTMYRGDAPVQAITQHSIGEFLRCSMGLSAWKVAGESRWALRVNPSSGNLHPTEAYILWEGAVYHYAPREHGLEARTQQPLAGLPPSLPPHFLVGLTSIHWREAWKYGERAFRYCQHDTGHALAALRLSAAMHGWRLALLPRWSVADVAAVLGVDRHPDFAGAEGEEPECIAVVTPGDPVQFVDADPVQWVVGARDAQWRGAANRLSSAHQPWPIIEEVAEATRMVHPAFMPESSAPSLPPSPRERAPSPRTARSVVIARRSAQNFLPEGAPLGRAAFLDMLDRLVPRATTAPWDALQGTTPLVHLIIFVHRVTGLEPGTYAFMRDLRIVESWRAVMRQDMLWEPVEGSDSHTDSPSPTGLFLLLRGDARQASRRLSCDQGIAGDGYFGMAMLARVSDSLAEGGEWMYRRLFWEAGMIGQVLYLDAEAAGARATGIGCYYDDPVHELLGLAGHQWQSLYHFSMGVPVEDTRLTTEPGYAWEKPLA